MQTWQLEALGTHWWVSSDCAEPLADLLEPTITKFENQYSRFRPDSLVSRLNRNGHINRPPAQFVAILQASLDYYRQTDGLFNITVGGRLESLGYGQGGGKIQPLNEVLTVERQSITLANGVHIDLGGIGKGWLIDLLGKQLRQAGSKNAVINGGGDILVMATSPQQLAIAHPDDNQIVIGEASLTSGGLATSSPKIRRWVHDGATEHHIIDPRSGSSRSSLAAVSVWAPTATEADVMATVMLLSTPTERRRLANKRSLEYLAVDDRGGYEMTPNMPVKMFV